MLGNPFQEMLKNDLETIIFNTKEVAQTHNWDSLKLPVVIDHKKLGEFKKETGLYQAKLLFYAQSNKVRHIPEPGNLSYFDEKQYEILSAEKYGGVFEVVLGVKKSG